MRHTKTSAKNAVCAGETNAVDKDQCENSAPSTGSVRTSVVETNLAHIPYYPLVAAGKLVGLSKSTMYRLIGAGMLDVFHVGSKRYVYTESLRSLPERLERRGSESALDAKQATRGSAIAINSRLLRSSGSKAP